MSLHFIRKTCSNCGKTYTVTDGGVISNPLKRMRKDLCPKCKVEKSKEILDILKR